MTCRIKIVGYANGMFCKDAGRYLRMFDFEAHGGRGYGECTDDLDEALEFTNPGAAMDFWRTQSLTTPVRSDGSPNKPLTACTIEIVGGEDEPDEAVAGDGW